MFKKIIKEIIIHVVLLIVFFCAYRHASFWRNNSAIGGEILLLSLRVFWIIAKDTLRQWKNDVQQEFEKNN